MEVCQSQSSHHSSMSFLDQIFGTDGRKHKEDGVWNWIKHQKNKKSNKALSSSGDLKVSTARDESGRAAHPHQQYHCRSNSRSSSLSTATTVTSHSYMCRTPTSPTSTFVPSCSSSFSSFSSSSTPAATSTSPVTASSSASPAAVSAEILSQVKTTPTTAHVCPAGLQKQQPTAQSNFTLPGVSTPIASFTSSTMTASTSQQQRPTFSSASSASSFSYSPGYDQSSTIRRSVSAGSARSSRSKGKELARDYEQEQRQQTRRQRWSSGATSFASSRASPKILEEREEVEGERTRNDDWWWE